MSRTGSQLTNGRGLSNVMPRSAAVRVLVWGSTADLVNLELQVTGPVCLMKNGNAEACTQVSEIDAVIEVRHLQSLHGFNFFSEWNWRSFECIET